jgi:diphthine-ammonia ligase
LDVCGEGGEYESLVLDCACFQRKLVITDSVVVYDEEDPSVGSLKILACAVVNKAISADTEAYRPAEVSAGEGEGEVSAGEGVGEGCSISSADPECRAVASSGFPLVFDNEGYCQSPLLFPPATSILTTAAAQLTHLLNSLTYNLKRYGVELHDIVFVHLYIADIALFDAINSEYCKWFGVDPPSRSCVAVSTTDCMIYTQFKSFES